MPNYDGPLYAPYNNMLTGKLTKRQWQEVFSIVRQKQKTLLEQYDEDYYNELGDILDKLYPLAYTSKEQLPDDWSYE